MRMLHHKKMINPSAIGPHALKYTLVQNPPEPPTSTKQSPFFITGLPLTSFCVCRILYFVTINMNMAFWPS